MDFSDPFSSPASLTEAAAAAFQAATGIPLPTQLELRDVLPDGLFPFAVDPGGDYFCIDLPTGKVLFYRAESEIPNGGRGRTLAESFPSFFSLLRTPQEAGW